MHVHVLLLLLHARSAKAPSCCLSAHQSRARSLPMWVAAGGVGGRACRAVLVATCQAQAQPQRSISYPPQQPVPAYGIVACNRCPVKACMMGGMRWWVSVMQQLLAPGTQHTAEYVHPRLMRAHPYDTHALFLRSVRVPQKPKAYRLACQTLVGDGRNGGSITVATKPQ
jgi:hypothetical protein